MQQPQKKAWSMKHPVLARVFAIALAVMSIILLFSGVKSIGDTKEENEERLRYEAKYSKRIENYVQLNERVENSISYEDAWAELEKIMEQHNADASQHRTDLAMYSAEKGGNTMGADMIWEAMPEIEAGKQELAAQKKKLEKGEAALNAVLQVYSENAAGISKCAAKADAAAGSEAFSTASASVQSVYAKIGEFPEMPAPPEEVAQPEEEVSEPDHVEDPGEEPNPEEASEEEIEAWRLKKEAYDAYLVEYQRYLDNRAAWDSYNNYINVTIPDYQAKMEAYPAKYGAWLAEVGAALGEASGYVQAVGGTVQSITQEAAAYFALFGTEIDTGGAAGGGGEAPDFTEMTPEQAKAYFTQAAGMLDGSLKAMKSGLAGIASGLRAIGPGLEAQSAALAEGRKALEAGEEQLKKAEHEARAALENIWYNLGELEKEREELEENKEKLDEEYQVLSKQILEADELKELENDHVSAKLLLTSVKEVNDMFEETGELVPSAEKYLEGYKADTLKIYQGRLIVCALAIAGAVMGLAAVPASYELIRRRFWLIAPVLACIFCSAAAETVYYLVKQEMWYVGLFVAVIALLHLLIVLPKEKKPAMAAEAAEVSENEKLSELSESSDEPKGSETE